MLGYIIVHWTDITWDSYLVILTNKDYFYFNVYIYIYMIEGRVLYPLVVEGKYKSDGSLTCNQECLFIFYVFILVMDI